MTDDEIDTLARKRVARKIGFYIHALVFVVVNAGLYTVNSIGGGYRWHWWPLGWWGLGLAIHGGVVFIGLRGDGLHDRMVASEVERLKRRR